MNVKDIIFIVLTIVLEAAFFFIAIKTIKKDPVNNIVLFFGIIAAHLTSGILSGNVFRHLLILGLYFVLLKLLYKKDTRFYDLFAVNIIFFIKGSLELIAFYIIHKQIENIELFHSVMIGMIFVIIVICIRKLLKLIYEKIENLFNRIETFYIRYTLSIFSILMVLIYYHITLQYYKGAM